MGTKKKEQKVGGEILREAVEKTIEQRLNEELDKEPTTGTRLKNPRREYFCRLWATDREFFGNGVESYAEAYDKDLSDPKEYNICKANAYRLLTNADILSRINELIDAAGFNDEHIDKQLLIASTQNADMGAKVKAISEYNKLKKRVEEKAVNLNFTLADLLNGVKATNSTNTPASPVDTKSDTD